VTIAFEFRGKKQQAAAAAAWPFESCFCLVGGHCTGNAQAQTFVLWMDSEDKQTDGCSPDYFCIHPSPFWVTPDFFNLKNCPINEFYILDPMSKPLRVICGVQIITKFFVWMIRHS
jgi:hypothetical protein